jgi:hypothetical protein
MNGPSNRTLITLSIAALFFVWLALLVTDQTTRVVEAVRAFLPSWFPVANLVLAPVLTALAAGPLRLSPAARFCATLLMLCSFSALYLAHAGHPLAYYLVIVFILAEAYWMIPQWKARCRRKESNRT